MSAKSTHLKLYDETEQHKFSVSCTNGTQKMEHATELRFDSALSFSHNDTSSTENSFTDLVLKVRNEDTTHEFSSGLLDGRITNTEGLIATEGINYLAHKAAIESSLSTEETRAITATDAIASDINDAVIARINNKSTLDSKILNMVSDRQTAITGYNTHVQDGIQEAQTQRTSGDAAVTQRIDTLMSIGEVDQTKLMEVVTEYQAADTAQIALIAGIQSDFDALKVRIDDVLVQESGSSGSGSQTTFDVKVAGTHYAGSTLLKIRLLEPDAQVMYDTLQQGDQLKITFDSGGDEIVTFDSFSNYLADNYYYLNVQSPVTLHYFQPDVIIEIV